MEFTSLFDKQREYEAIIECDSDTRLKKKILALLVELGESANEKPEIFKYWSSQPKGSMVKTAEEYAAKYQKPVIPISKDPLLEELSDMFAFILSLGLELDLDQEKISLEYPIRFSDLSDLYIEFSHHVTYLYTLWSITKKEPVSEDQPTNILEVYLRLLNLFFSIVYEHGYDEKNLEEAYLVKNKINFDRQKQGY